MSENEFYKVLALEQGSDPWKQERLKYVTASQTASLLGLSPYQSAVELMREKITGKESDLSSYKQRLFDQAHDAEASARQWIESRLGIKLPPLVIVSKRCPGLLASLDGFHEPSSIILEAKFMGAKGLEEVKAGKIKKHHIVQIQSQLLASGAKKCIYFATTADGTSAVKEIRPDVEYAKTIQLAVSMFMDDLIGYQNYVVNLLQKQMNAGKAPLRVLASGAKDPFTVRVR